jgi:hypothetical protein
MARTVTLQNKSVDPVGAPDFTLPVSIIAQVIPQLDVNIAAQSIPTLNINIASIASGVVFNVAQSGAWTVNAAQTGTWTINIGQPLDASGNLKTSIQTSVTLNVNIVGSTTLNINISSISSGVTFNVNITGSTTLNINISSITSGVVFNVAQSGSWTVNVSNTSFNVNVTNSSLTVTVSGTVNVNVTNSSLTVTISGTPTINVQTSSGANIIIDKLTQGAYTENRCTLSNNGATASWEAPSGNERRGKFFPRGCRGFLKSVDVYCKNPSPTTSGAITVYISPHPAMGPVASSSISLGVSAAEDWRSVTFNRMWNYDSMFVFAVCSGSAVYGYDAGTPYDGYASSDAGASWSADNCRRWFRLSLTGETVGDLPVSGTINTIEVPNASTRLSSGAVSVPSGSETSLLTVAGSGKLIEARISLNVSTPPSSSVYYNMYIYCDGSLAYQTSNLFITQSETATSGRSAIGEFVQAGGITYMNVRVPLEFRRSIELRVYQTSGSTATPCYGDLILSLKQ